MFIPGKLLKDLSFMLELPLRKFNLDKLYKHVTESWKGFFKITLQRN